MHLFLLLKTLFILGVYVEEVLEFVFFEVVLF